MDTYTPATDVDPLRERIKLAWSNYEFCNECGMPMVIETHGSRLWIECRTLRSLSGLRLYLSYAYSHGLTYGALATPITFLLFYYFISMSIIIGAQFNNALLEYYPPMASSGSSPQ